MSCLYNRLKENLKNYADIYANFMFSWKCLTHQARY